MIATIGFAECQVTNRFLSDLEQAITSPSGGSSRLPCCFLERDLDRADAQIWPDMARHGHGNREMGGFNG